MYPFPIPCWGDAARIYYRRMKAFQFTRLVRLALSVLAASAAARLQAAAGPSVLQQLETFDTDVRNYNVISFGNSNFTNFGDTQGPLAILGNLYLDGGTVAAQPSNFGVSSDPTLYVTGQLTLNGTTQLNSGYASTPGLTPSAWSWNATQKQLTGGGGVLSSANTSAPDASIDPINNPAPASWNWTTLASQFGSIASTLAAAPTTGTITVNSQNLIFTAPASPTNGVAVFTLDASKISGNTYDGQTFSNIQINVPTGVTDVINVINASGTTIFGSGANFNAGTNDSSLLWNIEGSGTVTLGGGQFIGAILAPNAVIDNGSNTAVSGQIVADGFNDTGAETHFTAFAVASVVVPEPAAFAWGAVGLCGLGIVLRRRRVGS
jgi:choice-of-anchor A domain-containing protein